MAQSQLPSNIAQLAGVFVESIFFGIYLVSFFASLRCLFLRCPITGRWTRCSNDRSMLTIVLLLFVFSTLNLALGFVRIVQALINNDHVGGGAVEQLGQDWVNILKPLTVNVQTTIADYAIIYRCWVVHARSWKIVILPGLIWLGECACTILSIYVQAILRPGESRVTSVQLLPVITTVWSATICLNIYVTSMIVWKIWRLVEENEVWDGLTSVQFAAPRNRLKTSMKIIIDSGLMYTITSFAVFVTLVSKSNAIFITSAINMQVTGIAFNLILIRVTRSRNELTAHANISNAIRFATVGDSSAGETGTDFRDVNGCDGPKHYRTEDPQIILDGMEKGQKEEA